MLGQKTVEIWRSVVGWEGYYEVSSEGRVRSVDRVLAVTSDAGVVTYHYKAKVRSLQKKKNGYRRLNLIRGGVLTNVAVHRLVAQAFIPNPENKRCVNHLDGDKSNNRVENLEWATHAENASHAFRTGLRRGHTREEHGRTKLTVDIVKSLKIRVQKGEKVATLAKEYGVAVSTVYRAIK